MAYTVRGQGYDSNSGHSLDVRTLAGPELERRSLEIDLQRISEMAIAPFYRTRRPLKVGYNSITRSITLYSCSSYFGIGDGSLPIADSFTSLPYAATESGINNGQVAQTLAKVFGLKLDEAELNAFERDNANVLDELSAKIRRQLRLQIDDLISQLVLDAEKRKMH